MVIGDRPTGRTTAFDADNECSNHSPRAAEEKCGPTRLRRAGVKVTSTSPGLLSQLFPSPCRLCGGPTWLADDEGGIHPCCELTWDGRRCPACDASEALNRSHRNRNSRPWKDAKGVD